MEEESKQSDGGGLPGWIATFADLMSLLMCFFVLLLAFSEMDVLKFKQIAGSMNHAFGVQHQVKVDHIPKGTSMIAREFSPGKPDPSPATTIMQMTTETLAELNRTAEMEADKEKLESELEAEIEAESVEIELKNQMLIIRLNEKASFASGDDTLKPAFEETLATIGELLKTIDGQIWVAGHTDSIPINTYRFRSNWALSSARAVSVTHSLIEKSGMKPSRFAIHGFADTKPLGDNATPEGRAKNRRVELQILKGQATEGDWQSIPELEEYISEESVEAVNTESASLEEPVSTEAAEIPPSNFSVTGTPAVIDPMAGSEVPISDSLP